MTVDFTNLVRKNKTYAGANGSKISVVYNGDTYMLKFPPQARKNKDVSYSNSCFSEYIGCKIFESIGIPVQEVILGTFTTDRGIEKIVVACRDFTTPGRMIQDFASLKNQIIDSEQNGYGTELEDIRETFEQQTAVDPIELKRRFWDMFIADALIGNWDRHNGNWGFLYDPITDRNELAPVFDCGSSLYPQADDQIMQKVLSNPDEMKTRVYDIPTSAIRENNIRINYYVYISSLKNSDCNAALIRIAPKIDLKKINSIVNETPFLTELQKKFYKTMLKERYKRIIEPAYKKLTKRESV